jgi:phosphohistidine phosphatase
MHLYLLRHGEAEPQSREDSTRALAARGKLDVDAVAGQFASRDILLTHCYYSPYLRTTQTAQVFLNTLNSSVKLEPLTLLTPDKRAKSVIGFLDTLDTLQAQHVLLVTHNPLVSELLALLTDGDIPNMHVCATSELNALTLAIPAIGQGQLLFRVQAKS